MRRRIGAVSLSLAFLFGTWVWQPVASPAAAGGGFTQLILHVNATTTVTVEILTHTGACTIVNSGSTAAGIDLGSANKTTKTFGCPTYTAGNTYKLVTSADFNATCSGTCNKWKLSANLSAAAATGLTWKLGGRTLNAASQQITNNITYGTAQNEALELDVKTNGTSAATGAIQAVLDFTASDTTTTTATASGTLNMESINEPGISIFFTQDASGVAMTGGAFDAAIDLGSVSAFSSLPSNVTRSNVNSSNYTVSTPIDITVELGGVVSTDYTLQADLAAAAATGFSYKVDSVTLTTSMQTITATGTYSSAQSHTIGIVLLRIGGASGPAINTPVAQTINFTATAN